MFENLNFAFIEASHRKMDDEYEERGCKKVDVSMMYERKKEDKRRKKYRTS